jgi:hypothetical protein
MSHPSSVLKIKPSDKSTRKKQHTELACCLLHKTVLPVTGTVDENMERDPLTYKLSADVCVSFSF